MSPDRGYVGNPESRASNNRYGQARHDGDLAGGLLEPTGMTRILLILLFTGCVISEEGDLDAPSPEGKIDGAGPSLTWPRLAAGASSPDVTTLQYLLTWSGFPTARNGVFDAATATAVRAFQRSRSLAPDAVVFTATWEQLIEGATIDAGDQGGAVEALQYLLKNRFGAGLSVTGKLGPTTLAALREVQRSRCLEATGVLGRYTWNALIAGSSFCRSPAVAAATRVLAAHRAQTLTLWNQTFGRADGADPLANITAAAAGRPAKTSCYGGAPCTSVMLTERLLASMAALREQRGFRYFVTAIAGATHSVGSLHYLGRAFDIDEVNGVRIQGDSAAARSFMAACRELGASEVFGPSNDPAGHSDHVHCGW